MKNSMALPEAIFISQLLLLKSRFGAVSGWQGLKRSVFIP
jgi:hypothetical protein